MFPVRGVYSVVVEGVSSFSVFAKAVFRRRREEKQKNLVKKGFLAMEN